MRRTVLSFFIFFCGLPALSQESLEERIDRLEAKLTAAELDPSGTDQELTKLRLQLRLPSALGPLFTGMGPSLSKIYFSASPLAVGAFVDLNYLSEDGGPRSTSVTRLNLNLGNRFSQSLIFNSSLALGGDSSGFTAPRVEQAYIDFLINEGSGLRAGHLLVPIGITNLRPEPTRFLTVNRPRPETLLIPSTWHENGVIGFGHFGQLVIQGGILSGLDAGKFETNSWIRSGRQSGIAAKSYNHAWIVRAEQIERDSLHDSALYGATVYIGDSAQRNGDIGRAQVLIGEIHSEIEIRRFSLSVLYTEGRLGDTELIHASSGQSPAKAARGAYAVLSYDLLPRIGPAVSSSLETRPPPASRALPIFMSWEFVDLNALPADGGRMRNDGLQSTVITVGFNYKPDPQVTIKTDFAQLNEASGASSRTLELGLSAAF